jgi:hypothetical protein
VGRGIVAADRTGRLFRGRTLINVNGSIIKASVSSGDGTIVATVSGGGISATAGGGFGPRGPVGPPGTTLWSGLAGVPESFPPSTHSASHGPGGSDQIAVSVGQVTGLQSSLDGKAESSHTHAASQITDFNTAVAAAAPPTTDASLLTSGTLSDARLSANVIFANDTRLSDARVPVSHTHVADDITSGTIAAARLGGGVADSSTFLRGDNQWASVISTAIDGGSATTFDAGVVDGGSATTV